MRHRHLMGLSASVLMLGIAGVTAQIPKVGPAPQIKPGDPGTNPQIKGNDPNKNPNPNPKGMNPVLPPGPKIAPPMQPKDPSMVVPPLMPEKKDDDFPKEIGEKTLVMWMNELKTSKDAAVRESAVRAFPLFGPRAMIITSDLMLQALKTDPDLNVKLAVMSIAPYMSYNQLEDPHCNDRLDFIIRMLNSESSAVRFEAINVLAGIGPVARKAIPQLVLRGNETGSWQIRRAAAAALGFIGRGWVNPENPAERIEPVDAAVTGLMNILKNDSSANVRREAANALITVGPVSTVQQKLWRNTLDGVLKNDKDRAVQGLVRVAILKNDPAGVKGNEALLNQIAAQLLSPEASARSEACQALGMIGDPANKKAQDLLDLITNPKEENGVTAAAIVAVANMKGMAGLTVPVLKKVAASHKSDDVKKYANEAINILQGAENKGVLPGVPVQPKVEKN